MGGEQLSVIQLPHLNVARPFGVGNRRHVKGCKDLLDSEEGFVKIKQRHIEEIILLGIDKNGARMGDFARHLIDFAILGKACYFFHSIAEIEFERFMSLDFKSMAFMLSLISTNMVSVASFVGNPPRKAMPYWI